MHTVADARPCSPWPPADQTVLGGQDAQSVVTAAPADSRRSLSVAGQVTAQASKGAAAFDDLKVRPMNGLGVAKSACTCARWRRRPTNLCHRLPLQVRATPDAYNLTIRASSMSGRSLEPVTLVSPRPGGGLTG